MLKVYYHGWKRIGKGKAHYYEAGHASCDNRRTAIQAIAGGRGMVVQFTKYIPERQTACPVCLVNRGLGKQLTLDDTEEEE